MSQTILKWPLISDLDEVVLGVEFSSLQEICKHEKITKLRIIDIFVLCFVTIGAFEVLFDRFVVYSALS